MIYRWFIGYLTVAGFLFVAGCAAPTVAPPQITQAESDAMLRNSVVKITCNGGLGSGAVVSANQVITTKHVTDGCTNMAVVFASGAVIPAAVQWSSAASDTAIVVLATPTAVVPLKTNYTPLVWGQRVRLVGFPFGAPYVMTTGTVAGIDNYDEGLQLSGAVLLDITGWHGNSGGPVLNDAGEIVGILHGGMIAGNDANIEVPVGLAIVTGIRSIEGQLRQFLV